MSDDRQPVTAKPAGVTAVIVAYNPAVDRFAQVLQAAAQASHILVVDNANGAGLGSVAWSTNLERIDMKGNAGVASAQNVGMQQAFARGATHVLLLDDDSVLAEGSVGLLLEAWHEKTRSGTRVAAVGARYLGTDADDESPFMLVHGLARKRSNLSNDPIVDASYVISSGSLISREAFEAVGPMVDALFIDYVDIEWGLRARAKGWRSFGVVDARMDHTLGDSPLKIFGKRYPFHSPIRHYYMFRNGVSLILRGAMPRGWKVREMWSLARRAVAYGLFAPDRRLHIAAICEGIIGGFAGRLGKHRLHD